MFDLQGMCRSPAFAFAVGSSKLKAASYERGSVLDGEIDTSKDHWYARRICFILLNIVVEFYSRKIFIFTQKMMKYTSIHTVM